MEYLVTDLEWDGDSLHFDIWIGRFWIWKYFFRHSVSLNCFLVSPKNSKTFFMDAKCAHIYIYTVHNTVKPPPLVFRNLKFSEGGGVLIFKIFLPKMPFSAGAAQNKSFLRGAFCAYYQRYRRKRPTGLFSAGAPHGKSFLRGAFCAYLERYRRKTPHKAF